MSWPSSRPRVQGAVASRLADTGTPPLWGTGAASDGGGGSAASICGDAASSLPAASRLGQPRRPAASSSGPPWHGTRGTGAVL